jgi:hypothetical protein
MRIKKLYVNLLYILVDFHAQLMFLTKILTFETLYVYVCIYLYTYINIHYVLIGIFQQ